MRFEEVAARLAVLPRRLPEPPDELTPVLLGGPEPADRTGPSTLPSVPGRLPRLRRTASSRAAIPWASGPLRHAAALVLIHPDRDGEARVVLIQRPVGDLRHPGEISLPGGEIEPCDASPTEAAMREAAEEVGLDPGQADVRVLGELSPVEIRVSRFKLIPILALASRAPRLRADPREVERVLDVPLRHFEPGAVIEIVEEVRAGLRMRYGAYPADGLRVWGATARVLGQLGALLAD